METKLKSNEEIKVPEITVKMEVPIMDGDDKFKKDEIDSDTPNEQAKDDTETIKMAVQEEVKAKVDFLNEQIGKRISTFDSLRAQNRRGALALRILSSMLGAVITILLGLKLGAGFETIVVNIALVLGSVITIVNRLGSILGPEATMD